MNSQTILKYFTCMYENRIITVIKFCINRGSGDNRRGELNQSAVYACIEISQ
jgi:hypothetical protein